MKRIVQKVLYGNHRELELEFPGEDHFAAFVAPQGVPGGDLTAAVTAALRAPLGFPPLPQATVPGDRITLAVDSETPRLPEVVAGVVQTLTATGTLAEDILIVLTKPIDESSDAWPTRRLAREHAAEIQVFTHNPCDRESLAYLAASKDNRPVLINRHLFDADLVVPIACARPDDLLGYAGTHDGLFPGFSDDATLRRFRSPAPTDPQVQQRLHRQEAEEAAWLLGVCLSIQIVPAGRDEVLQVVAGAPDAVTERVQALNDSHWVHRLREQSRLVVAAIDGGPVNQTWDALARSLTAAAIAVEDDGAVLLCTGLSGGLGPGLQRLLAADDAWHAVRDIRHDRPADAAAACALVQLQERAAVYLLSDLDGEIVEALGMGYVEDKTDVERLIRQFDSCIMIQDAHRVVLRTGGKDEP